MAYLLKKGDLNSFVELLISKYEVIAPVNNISGYNEIYPSSNNMEKSSKKIKCSNEITNFAILKKGEADKLVFNIPLYPAKDWFLPANEELLKFKKEKIEEVKKTPQKRIFFMNRCDVNAVHRNDLIMLDEPQDPYYKQKRDASILIEVPCVVSNSCKCVDIDLIDCYDIKLISDTSGYIIDINTRKGQELMDKVNIELNHNANTIKLTKTEYIKQPIKAFKSKEVKTDNKKVWENYGKDCLSCSACTVVCPTCMCFTIDGHLDLDLKSGCKYREWASCQLPSFTKVAGGFVFRRDRGMRGKQRIHCKFIYFKEKYGHPRCVGCGRCNAACPVDINIYEYYGELK